MRRCVAIVLAGWCCLVMTGSTLGGEPPGRRITDSRLKAANEHVRQSQRYLHHDQLQRGMTGYGLTVMSGTEIVRFNVEIVSVVVGYGPQRDVIYARVHGLDLRTSGVIAGMSGSPIFVRHEGRDKMIGALAYGWTFQKSYAAGPLCGIQPISQMLAVAGVPLGDTPATTQPAQASAPAAAGRARLSPAWRQQMFAVEKIDFTELTRPTRQGETSAGMTAEPRLQPLTTPLMVGGLAPEAMSYLTGSLSGAGLQPIRSGQLGRTQAAEAAEVELAPGSSLVVPLVTGDEDISGIGTVTDVIGDHVIGFGHPMFGDGAVSFPMATGYVHTVVASLSRSFKIGSTIRVVGEIQSDEITAIGGQIGRRVDMIPVKVDVAWPEGRSQQYSYQIIRDRSLTGMLALTVLMDSVWGTSNLPIEHSVQYEVAVDFGPLGTYRVANLSSKNRIYDMGSDLARPLSAMLNNPFKDIRVESIAVKVNIEDRSRLIRVLGATLDRNSYAPGDTVTATVKMLPWRGERTSRTISVRLPDDLDEGTYQLNVGDWTMALRDHQKRRPRLFDPRTAGELLAAVQSTSERRMDRLYAIVSLPTGGVTVGTAMIDRTPPTVATMLKAARPLDVSAVGEAVTSHIDLDRVVSGQAELEVIVMKHPPRP